jgi:hypothetical protein
MILQVRLDPIRKEQHAIYIARSRRRQGMQPTKRRSATVLQL